MLEATPAPVVTKNGMNFAEKRVAAKSRTLSGSPAPADTGLGGGGQPFPTAPFPGDASYLSMPPQSLSLRSGYTDTGVGVRHISCGKSDELWLKALHTKDAYGPAYNSAAAGDILEIAGGDLLAGRIETRSVNRSNATTKTENLPDNEIIGDKEVNKDDDIKPEWKQWYRLFNDRGQAMTWKMYNDKWDDIEAIVRSDPTKASLLVCEYVNVTHDATLEFFFDYVENEQDSLQIVQSSFGIGERTELEKKSSTDPSVERTLRQFHLLDIMKKIEGFYVMKNRPIGDITEPLFVGFAGMMWTVYGYRRLTARVVAELCQLETHLKDWFRDHPLQEKKIDLKMLLLVKELTTPIAQLLDAMLVFRYTSHQQPYDMKAVERCGIMYENGCDKMIQIIERLFS